MRGIISFGLISIFITFGAFSDFDFRYEIQVSEGCPLELEIDGFSIKDVNDGSELAFLYSIKNTSVKTVSFVSIAAFIVGEGKWIRGGRIKGMRVEIPAGKEWMGRYSVDNLPLQIGDIVVLRIEAVEFDSSEWKAPKPIPETIISLAHPGNTI